MATSVANSLSGPTVLIFIEGAPSQSKGLSHGCSFCAESMRIGVSCNFFASGQCFAVYFEVAGLVPPHVQGFLLSLSFTLLALVDTKPSSLARVFRV